jgi:hypothetical protein
MRLHELKCWPDEFTAVMDGRKTNETRKTYDRDFRADDYLLLREWEPRHAVYTGSVALVRVRHVETLACGALPVGVCVMSIERVYPQEPALITEPKIPATITERDTAISGEREF